MTRVDLVNAAFVSTGAILQWTNVWRLATHKQVAGVVWPVTAFSVLWNLWDVHLFLELGIRVSAVAAVFMAAANVSWVVLALRYRRF